MFGNVIRSCCRSSNRFSLLFFKTLNLSTLLIICHISDDNYVDLEGSGMDQTRGRRGRGAHPNRGRGGRERGPGRGRVPQIFGEPEMVSPLNFDCSEYIGSPNHRVLRRRRSGYPVEGTFTILY